MRARIRILIGILFLITIVVLRMLGVFDIFTVDFVRIHAQYLTQLVQNHYLFAAMCYIGAYSALMILALPLATLLTLLGGFLFGTFWGGLYAIISATCGATASFLMVRFFLGEALQQKYAAQLQQFNALLSEYGMWYLLVLRLIPIFPFFLINIFSGLTQIPTHIFVTTTCIGIMPSAFIFAFMGRQLYTIASVQDLFSTRVVVALLLCAVLVVLGAWWHTRMRRKTKMVKHSK